VLVQVHTDGKWQSQGLTIAEVRGRLVKVLDLGSISKDTVCKKEKSGWSKPRTKS
jgi:hypothetical protein